ncbi:MAG: hypothetical protein JXP34_18005 [Planctomycetes bacterium]|nr:hypothetical protein [Planctomycetota bacterium]
MRMRWLSLIVPVLTLCGCLVPEDLRYREPERIRVLPPSMLSSSPAELEERIRKAFETEPDLPESVRLAVHESGTQTFDRLFGSEGPALEGDGDAIAAVLPVTGSPLVEGVGDLQSLRAAVANARADTVLVVHFLWDTETSASPLAFFDITIVGAFLIPAYSGRIRAAGQAIFVDTRTGLVLDVAEVAKDGPWHFVPLAWMAGRLRGDLRDIRSTIAEDLAKRVQAAAKQAASGAERGPSAGT